MIKLVFILLFLSNLTCEKMIEVFLIHWIISRIVYSRIVFLIDWNVEFRIYEKMIKIVTGKSYKKMPKISRYECLFFNFINCYPIQRMNEIPSLSLPLDLLQEEILHFRLSIWICYAKLFFNSELKFGFVTRKYSSFLI